LRGGPVPQASAPSRDLPTTRGPRIPRGFLLLWRPVRQALKTAFAAYRKLKQSESHGEVAYIQLLIANCYQRLGLVAEAEEFFMDSLSRIAAPKTAWHRVRLQQPRLLTRMRAAVAGAGIAFQVARSRKDLGLSHHLWSSS
jgi:hypothetical protein